MVLRGLTTGCKSALRDLPHKLSSQFENLLYLCSQIENYETNICEKYIERFWGKHPASEQYLKTWYDTAMNTDWKTPNEVKQSYASASILKDSRIVFNIKVIHIDW
jgi:hypothetical protein